MIDNSPQSFEDLLDNSPQSFEDLLEDPTVPSRAGLGIEKPEYASALDIINRPESIDPVDPLMYIDQKFIDAAVEQMKFEQSQVKPPSEADIEFDKFEDFLDRPSEADLEFDKFEEWVKEKEHHDFFAQEAKRFAIEKAKRLADGFEPVKPRIDPDMLKPGTFQKGGAGEYIIDKLSNETIIGKASIILAGTIQAAMHGGNPVDYYRDIYDDNNQTIMGYQPNMLQDAMAGFLGVTIDLPVFQATGIAYNKFTGGALKYASEYAIGKFVKAGSTMVLAEKYAANGLVKFNSVLQTATVLGTHAEINDIATQHMDGASFGELDWDRAMKIGYESAFLGAGLGLFGVGSSWLRNSPYFERMVDSGVAGRLVSRGYPAISFGGELSVFTYGQAMLDSDKKWYETSLQDWINNAAIVGGLKTMHSRHTLPTGKGLFSYAETEAIRKHTKDLSPRDPLRSLVEQDKVEAVLNDPKIPYSVKFKIADRAGVKIPMPLIANVKMEAGPKGAVVRSYDRKGKLIQEERFNSEAEAYPLFNDLSTAMGEMGLVQEMARLTPKNQLEFDKRLERAGIEGGITNEWLQHAVTLPPSQRTPEAKKVANICYDEFNAFKAEKLEVKEGEKVEPLFKEKKVEPEPTVKEVAEAAKEAVKPYTPEEIELKFEHDIRLRTKIEHPVHGIDKLLNDLAEIRRTKDYKKGVLKSKTLTQHFPEAKGDQFRIKSEAELNAAKKRLLARKKTIETELARRKKAEEPAIETGNFVFGRRAYETKQDLFRELDKFETLEGTLPEVNDFNTMLAIRDYELAKKSKPTLAAQDFKNLATKLRSTKGALDPKPGELRVSIPGMGEMYDIGIEVMAKALDGGAAVLKATGKAIEAIRSQTFYTRLSEIEQKRAEKELLRRWGEIYGDEVFGEQKPLPPKTPTQKKIDVEVEGKHKVSKVTLNEYTGLKEQIRGQAKIAKDVAAFQKQAREDIQKAISSKEWVSSLGMRTTKTIARRLAGMDVNKPGSVIEVLDYIEKVLTDAKVRIEAIDIAKQYEQLDELTSPTSYQRKDKGLAKGKGIDPTYIDKLKRVRNDMLNKNWKEAQEKILEFQDKIEQLKPGDPLLDSYLDQIEGLAFHGLLTPEAVSTVGYLKSRVDDITSIRKEGKTLGAAKRFFLAAERVERVQKTLDVLNAGVKQVILETDRSANLKPTRYENLVSKFDWTGQDSWFTLWDKLSKYDKNSRPLRSYLSRKFGGYEVDASHAENTGKRVIMNEVNAKAEEIFGVKGANALTKKLRDHTQDKHVLKWTNAKGEVETLKWSMNQAYKRWMELQDPTIKASLIKQGYFDQFGEPTAKYEAVEKILTPEVKKWAEWQLNEFFPKYWESINEVYRDIYGTDMPYHDKYSPIFVADKIISPNDAIDHMMGNMDFRGMAGNNHLKLRSGHAKQLLLLDGDKVLMSYIDKMEYFKAWARPLREMNHTLSDRAVRESIRQNFGPKYNKAIDSFMDDFAKKPKNTSDFERVAKNIRVNFTLGSLGFKPTVLLKQLTSIPAFADNIPVASFSTGVLDYFANFNTANKILNASDMIITRYGKGWDRDVMLAMQKDASAMVAGKKTNMKDTFMFMTKYGDKAAIFVGGWPVYKYHYDLAIKENLSEPEARKIAMDEFEFAARNSQQASQIADQSAFQRGSEFQKWMTMYVTAPMQYHRKVTGAARNLAAGRGTVTENVKTIMIYHVLLPQLFQLASNGFKFDLEDQAVALVVGNFNRIFIAGDMMQGAINQLRNLPYAYNITPIETLTTDMYKAAGEVVDIPGILKDLPNTSLGEILDAVNKLGKVVGHTQGLPISGVMGIASGIVDAASGETDDPIRRILGYSEYTIEGGFELWELPEEIRKKINKNLNDPTKSYYDLLEELGNPTSFEDLLEE